MVKKHHKFRFTPKVLIRLIIFLFIIAAIINYISTIVGQKQTIKINYSFQLSPLYEKLPPSTRSNIENIGQRLYYIQAQGLNYFNYQIKEIRKSFAKKIANEIETRITQE